MPRALHGWSAVYLLDVLLTRPPIPTPNDDPSCLLLALVPSEIMASILMIVARDDDDCNAFLAFVLSSKAARSFVAPVASDLLRCSRCKSWESAQVVCAELRSVLAAERFLSSGTVQDFDSSMNRLYQKLCLGTGFCGIVDDRFLESEAFFWANDSRPVIVKKRSSRGPSSSTAFHALDMKKTSSLFEPLSVSHSGTQNIVKDHLSEVIGFASDQVELVPVTRSVDADGNDDMFVVAGPFALFSVVKIDQHGVVEERSHAATFQTAIRRHSLCALEIGPSSPPVADVMTACIVEEQFGSRVEFRWQGGQRSASIDGLMNSILGKFAVVHSLVAIDRVFYEWAVCQVGTGQQVAMFACRELSVDQVTGKVVQGDGCPTANIMLPAMTCLDGFQCMQRGGFPSPVGAKPHVDTTNGKVTLVLPFRLEHSDTSTATPDERSKFRMFSPKRHILVTVDVRSAQITTSNFTLECLNIDSKNEIYDVSFTPSGRFGAITHGAGTTFFDAEEGHIANWTHHSRIQPVVSFGKGKFAIQTDDTVFMFEKIIRKIDRA